MEEMTQFTQAAHPGSTMRCEKCHSDTHAGQTYFVGYGNLVRTTSSQDGKTLSKSYNLAGTESVFLCEPCVNREVNRLAMYYSLAFLFIGLATDSLQILFTHPAKALILPGAFVLLMAGGLYLAIRRGWKKGKNNERVGDRMAIRIRKPQLSLQGYDRFYTREDWAVYRKV